MDIGLRFRVVQDYAAHNGFVGGVPTYFNATYQGRVYGALMLPASVAEWRDVPDSQMPLPSGADFGTRMRAAQDYAAHNSFAGAIPTFFDGNTNGVVVHGLLLLKQGGVQWRDVTAFDLGNPPVADVAARFRATQTYATAQGMVGGLPTFYQADRVTDPIRQVKATFYGTLLFPHGTAEWRDVHAEELGAGPIDDPATRMRLLQQYATRNGFVGAFANFFQADYGPGLVYGAVLVSAPGAQFRDVSAADLNNPPDGDDGALFRAVQDYAKTQNLPAAFPTFNRANRNGATVYGVVLLNQSIAEWRDVPVGALLTPNPTDAPARFRATQTYAVANGAVGGFPNFYEASLPGGTVNGTVLLRGPSVQFRDIAAADLFPDAIVGGAIRVKWNSLGGPAGFLGAPLTPELPCADGIGRYNRFEGGVIYFTPAKLCFEVHGGILDRWNSYRAESGYLGYPVTDEGPWTSLAGKPGRISTFERGAIGWDNGPIDLPLVFQPPAAVISTPAGTALGGSVAFLVRSDGTYSFTYHLHDSGLTGYDFSIHAAFAAANGMTLLDTFGGSVAGTVGSGSRDTSQTNPYVKPAGSDKSIPGDPLVAANWSSFQQGKLIISKDYGASGVAGAFLEISKAILDIGVGAGAGWVGVVIAATSVIGSLLPSFGPGQTLGVIAGVVVFNFGYGLIIAGISGVAVTAVSDALIAHRQMSNAEIQLATPVFHNTVPFDRVRITNLNVTGRAFTAPGADGLIYINTPVGYSELSTVSGPYPANGQLLIHELTHAWQIVNTNFLPGLVCLGVVTQANNTIVNTDVYHVGPPGPPWSDFGIEAQATIVDQWFQRGSVESDSDPYFTYIRDNIRARRG